MAIYTPELDAPMRTRTLILMLAAAALLAPGVQGQQLQGITVVASEPIDPVDPGTTATQEFSVSVGCATILQAGGSSTVAVNVSAPVWMGATGTDVELDPTGCIPGGSVAGNGTITYAPTNAAPGFQPAEIAITAMLGDETGETTTTAQAGYRPGYQFTFAPGTTIMVTNASESVTMQITVTANADTMLMFEAVEGAMGSVAIPTFINVVDQIGQETTLTQDLTYTPPLDDWTEDTFIFKTWSHYMQDGDLKTPDQQVTLVFVNDLPPGSGGDSEEEESPGVAVPILIGALAAIAIARRR